MEANNREKWHLRMAITANCNFRCKYCNPYGVKSILDTLSKKEVTEILQSAYNCGIRRVHWTGGEPTLRKDFPELVRIAKEIGFHKQIITTNGYKLYKILDELINNGLTRVIISIDTLDPERNKFITDRDFLFNTLKSIEEGIKKLASSTKISVVTMKSTLNELKDFVNYAQDLNNREGYAGELIIKLNQFFPSNPAQLFPEGQEFWRREFVSYDEILHTLEKIGPLRPIPRREIEGDNPSYRYFLIEGTGVKVGILALFSWRYPCGRCYKLRIQPDGSPSICLNLPKNPTLIGKSLKNMEEYLRMLIRYREEELDGTLPNRKHYRPQLGEMRFGNLGKAVSMEYFYK